MLDLCKFNSTSDSHRNIESAEWKMEDKHLVRLAWEEASRTMSPMSFQLPIYARRSQKEAFKGVRASRGARIVERKKSIYIDDKAIEEEVERCVAY